MIPAVRWRMADGSRICVYPARMSIETKVFCRTRPVLEGEIEPTGDIRWIAFEVERAGAADWDELRQAGFRGDETPADLPWVVRFSFKGDWYDGFDAAGPALARRCGGGLVWGRQYRSGKVRRVAARPDPGSWTLLAAVQAAFDLGADHDEARWRVEVGEAEEGEDDGATVDADEDHDDGDDDDEVHAPATDRGGWPRSGSVSGAARAEDSDEPRDAWWQDGAGTTFAVLGGNGEAALRDQSAFKMIPRAEIASLRDRAVWPIQKMQALAAAVTDEVAPWSMGCCAVSGKRLAIATIGDVRAYRLRGGRGIELLTDPPASAAISVRELEGAALDIFVLCTHGLWSHFEGTLEGFVRDAVRNERYPASMLLRMPPRHTPLTAALAILCL